MSEKFAVVILAAGLAKRYGKNKLVEKIVVEGEEISIIEQVVKSFKHEKIAIIILILSPKYGSSIKSILQKEKNVKIHYVDNLDPESGMSLSVKLGIKKLNEMRNELEENKEETKYLIITPADYPGYTKKLIESIINKVDKLNADIMIPTYNSRRGHPLIVNMGLVEELQKINEDNQGMKGFLRNNQQKIVEFNIDNPSILRDIDKRKDLPKIYDNS